MAVKIGLQKGQFAATNSHLSGRGGRSRIGSSPRDSTVAKTEALAQRSPSCPPFYSRHQSSEGGISFEARASSTNNDLFARVKNTVSAPVSPQLSPEKTDSGRSRILSLSTEAIEIYENGMKDFFSPQVDALMPSSDYFAALKDVPEEKRDSAIVEADRLRENGDYLEALAKYTDLLPSYEVEQDDDKLKALQASVRIGLAVCQKNLNKFSEAVNNFESAFNWARTSSSRYCHQAVEIYTIYAGYLDGMGLYQEALFLKMMAYSIKAKISDHGDQKLLRCMNNIAISFLVLGKKQEALKLSRLILDISLEKSGSQSPAVTESYYFLGYVNFILRDYLQARENFSKMIKIRERKPESCFPPLAIARDYLGFCVKMIEPENN